MLSVVGHEGGGLPLASSLALVSSIDLKLSTLLIVGSEKDLQVGKIMLSCRAGFADPGRFPSDLSKEERSRIFSAAAEISGAKLWLEQARKGVEVVANLADRLTREKNLRIIIISKSRNAAAICQTLEKLVDIPIVLCCNGQQNANENKAAGPKGKPDSGSGRTDAV
jgi:hypothetical protein